MELSIKLNKAWQLAIIFLLIFSVFHLFRDIFQIFKVDSILATQLDTDKSWCNPYCDYVTIPPELFIIIASTLILLKRKIKGLFEAIVLVFIIWSLVFLLSYINY